MTSCCGTAAITPPCGGASRAASSTPTCRPPSERRRARLPRPGRSRRAGRSNSVEKRRISGIKTPGGRSSTTLSRWASTMGRSKNEDYNARFATVGLRHLADAYALARWLTGDRADAEDVVQEACLRAFRGIGGFAGVNARAWLLTIVRHAAYTWLGKNRSAALVMVDDLEAVEQKQASAGAFGQEPQTPE